MSRTKVKIEKAAGPKLAVDLQELARRVGKAGSVWLKRNLKFDFPIEVESIALVLDSPEGARSITFQSYGGFIGKAAARLESLEGAGSPIKGEVGQYLAKLERRGYRIVAVVDSAEPAAKKTRRGRKAAAPTEPTAGSRLRRRKAD
jgi:hypothetical protein